MCTPRKIVLHTSNTLENRYFQILYPYPRKCCGADRHFTSTSFRVSVFIFHQLMFFSSNSWRKYSIIPEGDIVMAPHFASEIMSILFPSCVSHCNPDKCRFFISRYYRNQPPRWTDSVQVKKFQILRLLLIYSWNWSYFVVFILCLSSLLFASFKFFLIFHFISFFMLSFILLRAYFFWFFSFLFSFIFILHSFWI